MNIQRNDQGDNLSKFQSPSNRLITLRNTNQNYKNLLLKRPSKGFRKGKTPISVISKMYGPSVFADMIDDLFNRALHDYLETEKIKYIAQPMLAEDQKDWPSNPTTRKKPTP